MRKGDELVVTRVDRLARSIGDLQDIVRGLKAKGVALRATRAAHRYRDGGGQVLLRHARQRRRRRVSIRAAGRRSMLRRCRRLAALGRSKTEIAEELEISRMSVYTEGFARGLYQSAERVTL
jgi:DNA invertase Pin-like site-specific DNA recombinase